MVQVDLITGFLGSGKTTFLRRYVQYLVAQGHSVCILENDFGAVNVDAMLLQDLIGEHCDIETISGGCDCDTHQRRMRTKLISMAMRGFDRVVIEPSGIFDVDEFYDILRDEPLDRWYTLGSVIAIVDAKLENELSPQADYLLASEAASAGLVVMSRTQLAAPGEAEAVIDHLNRALAGCHCARHFGADDVLCRDWNALTTADFARVDRCGWRQTSYVKLHFDEHKAFTSLYFLEARAQCRAGPAGRADAPARREIRPCAARQGVYPRRRRLGRAERRPRRHNRTAHSQRSGGADRDWGRVE